MKASITSAPKAGFSNRFYELCWEYARDALFVADVETGLLVDIIPAAAALTGHTRQDLTGRHFSTLYPEVERASLQKAYDADSAVKAILDGFHLLRKDGGTVPVSISTSAPFESGGRWMTIEIHRDNSAGEEREHRLSTQNWALTAYAAAALALGKAGSPQALLDGICEAIAQDSAYLLAWVGVAEENPGKHIEIASVAGAARGYLDGLQLSWSEDDPSGHGPVSTCIRTNTPQIIQDYQSSAILPVWLERARQIGIRSSVSIPFSVEGGWHGALTIYSSRYSAFSAEAIEVFEHLAKQIGHGLHALDQTKRLSEERQRLAQTESRLVEALSAMVAPIITTMEVRDPYTAGHQSRVAEIACAIAREMNWEEDRLQGLRMAALVHDVGKIAIPAEILAKPTRLTAPEWALIKEHPESGYEILKDIPFRWPIAETVRQHHERLDGSGYPKGLKGDLILPGARILAVADIVESMASSRPYRPALGVEVALAEIEKQAGTLLDADVVRICALLFREKGFRIPGWNLR